MDWQQVTTNTFLSHVQRQSLGDEYLAGVAWGDFRKKYSENNSHINTKKQGKTDLIRCG